MNGATFATDVRELRDLAERIRDLEPSAIELLRPDGADPDCPAGFRSLGGGVVLHELGPLAPLIDRAVVLAHGRVERTVEDPSGLGHHPCHPADEAEPSAEPTLHTGML